MASGVQYIYMCITYWIKCILCWLPIFTSFWYNLARISKLKVKWKKAQNNNLPVYCLDLAKRSWGAPPNRSKVRPNLSLNYLSVASQDAPSSEKVWILSVFKPHLQSYILVKGTRRHRCISICGFVSWEPQSVNWWGEHHEQLLLQTRLSTYNSKRFTFWVFGDSLWSINLLYYWKFVFGGFGVVLVTQLVQMH